MSEKVLKLAGKRPIMLVVLVMATLTLGLLFSGWLTPTTSRAQVGDGNPPPSHENTNCIQLTISQSCISDGSVRLQTPTPANGPAIYVGGEITVSTGVRRVNAARVLSTATYSNCPPDVWTNWVNPTYDVTWTASVGSYSTNGTGMSATFNPTASGCGSVVFTCWYTNQTPCSGTGSSSVTNTFSVAQVATNCTDGFYTLANGSISPASSYIGTNITASASAITSNAVVVVTTSWDCSANASIYTTNYITPGIVSNSWTASVGSFSANGSGLFATFTPTDSGCGAVVFTCWYTNQTPCGGMGSASVTNNFSVAQFSTNCTDGFYTLTNGSISPVNGYIGTNITATAGAIASNAVVVVTTIWPCSTNASIYATNYITPGIVSNSWTASVGSYSTNGSGLTASFAPAASGCGSVVFTCWYTNQTPCSGTGSASVTNNFSVALVSTNCGTNLWVLGSSTNSSATNICLGSVASFTATNNNVANQVVVTTHWDCSTNADIKVTNSVSPTMISSGWTITQGSYTTNGTGLTASFTPTNSGSGTATFTETFKLNTSCDSSIHTNSLTLSFNVCSLITNCATNGSLVLTNGTMTPTNGCLGSAFTATASIITNMAIVITNCPCGTNTYLTNYIAPTVVSNWWTASVGTYSTNGQGVSATFNPTNGGTGTVVFHLKYKNNTPCDTNVTTAPDLTNSFTVIQITNQCVATTPANRVRTTIGVCEEVDIGLAGSPSGTFTWSASVGSLSQTNGTNTRFTAPDTETNSIISVYYNGGECNIQFTINKPSGVRFVKLADKHVQGWLDAGFHVQCIIMNTNVSFYNIEISELEATATATGCFSCLNGQIHKRWTDQGITWLTPAQNNYLSTVVDYSRKVACNNVGPGPGTFSWDIPWNYRRHGASNDGYNIVNITSSANATTNECTVIKNGVSATFKINDPSVEW